MTHTTATPAHHGETWSAEEIEFIRVFRDSSTAREIGEALGRTVESVRSMWHLVDRDFRDSAGRKRHTPEAAGFQLQFSTGWQDRMLKGPQD